MSIQLRSRDHRHRLLVPSACTASSLCTSLISYWKADESSGTLLDAHGSSHLTDTNTVTTAAGKQGTARQFTAANLEYFTTPDNASLSTGDIDFTIAAWVYLDSKAAQRPICGKWATPNEEYILIYDVSIDRFRLYLSADGVASVEIAANTLGSPALATWYLVIAWHDSVLNTRNICVNNGTVDSVAHTTGVRDGTAAFTVGRNLEAALYMDGRIDEIGFWKKVLSAAERTALYAAGSGITYPFS